MDWNAIILGLIGFLGGLLPNYWTHKTDHAKHIADSYNELNQDLKDQVADLRKQMSDMREEMARMKAEMQAEKEEKTMLEQLVEEKEKKINELHGVIETKDIMIERLRGGKNA